MKPDRLDTLDVALLEKMKGTICTKRIDAIMGPTGPNKCRAHNNKVPELKWVSKGGEHPRMVVGQPKKSLGDLHTKQRCNSKETFSMQLIEDFVFVLKFPGDYSLSLLCCAADLLKLPCSLGNRAKSEVLVE